MWKMGRGRGTESGVAARRRLHSPPKQPSTPTRVPFLFKWYSTIWNRKKNTLGLCRWWPPVLCHDKHGTPAYPLTYTETKAREPNMPRASFRSGGKVFNKITIDHDGSRAVRATGQDRNTTQAAVRMKYGQPSTAINTRWGSPLVDRPTGPISFVSSVMLIWVRRAAGKCDGLQLFIGMVAIW